MDNFHDNHSYIEPSVLPLVKALNDTGIVSTFSSCEGHYGDTTEVMDREKAEVRFDAEEDIEENQVEKMIRYIISEYAKSPEQWKCSLIATKYYIPQIEDDGTDDDHCFILSIKPFNRFDKDAKKRSDTDICIIKIAEIVKLYPR
jgi:hypothetical protein